MVKYARYYLVFGCHSQAQLQYLHEEVHRHQGDGNNGGADEARVNSGHSLVQCPLTGIQSAAEF